ncbi:hypothetical protein PoB_005344000 [Plakobranchus ocellatus]|uniref:Uncharacterized protein n=1 Tax=Plakobranchus ocellatus TaxID=259542 RepID=A0AAV4C2N0_9GAST|nr:hypothetical protein PoB_005344000 [Plakobranchus ocellatus]
MSFEILHKKRATLVAETLVLAKTHGYVEKIEHELEEELQRDEREPDSRYLANYDDTGIYTLIEQRFQPPIKGSSTLQNIAAHTRVSGAAVAQYIVNPL